MTEMGRKCYGNIEERATNYSMLEALGKGAFQEEIVHSSQISRMVDMGGRR